MMATNNQLSHRHQAVRNLHADSNITVEESMVHVTQRAYPDGKIKPYKVEMVYEVNTYRGWFIMDSGHNGHKPKRPQI